MFETEKGFTLIEIIVASLILFVVAVPLTHAFFQGRFLAVSAGDKTIALNLAQQKMEEIIAQGSAAEVAATPFPGDYAGYSYQVDTSPAGEMQLVTVSVTYFVSQHDEQVSLSLLLPGGA